MLSSILSKEECAVCKFCCSFRRESLWETPLFDFDFAFSDFNKDRDFTLFPEHCLMSLEDNYETDEPDEEVPCFYLDKDKGCTLSAEDKPFDCKIWPLRLMDMDGKLVIALTPTCPTVNKVSLDDIKTLLAEGLGEKIFDYGKSHKYIIKDYREGFPVLMSEDSP